MPGATLYSGNGCHVDCDDGYVASGITRCVAGGFVEYATCVEENAPAPTTAPTAAADPDPTAAPTAADSAGPTCADSTSWYRKKTKNTCEGYVAKKSKYCKSKTTDSEGVSALEACPVTCDECPPWPCEDSTSWYLSGVVLNIARHSFRPDRWRKKAKNTCEGYVSKKSKYCKEKVADTDGVSALDACPVTCLQCEVASAAPTAAPTDACADSTSWYNTKKSKNTCTGYVAKKSKYCKSKVVDADGVSAIDACLETCGLC